MYDKGTKDQRRLEKSKEKGCGTDVPAEMDRGLKIKDSAKRYGKEINAEIE